MMGLSLIIFDFDGTLIDSQACRTANLNHVAPPMFAGTRALLDGLVEDGYQLAIATGMGCASLHLMLDHHGIGTLFTALYTADDGPAKPDPTCLLELMDLCQVTVEHTVMIGDTIYDMQAARAANMDAIGVDWGYHDAQRLTQAGAMHILSSPEAIRAFCKQNWSG